MVKKLYMVDRSPQADRSAGRRALITMVPADRQEIKGFVFGPHATRRDAAKRRSLC